MNKRLSTGKREESEKESKRDITVWNRFFLQPSHSASADMPNFAGTWKMKRSENFDELLKALGKPYPVSFFSVLSPSSPSLHEADYPSCPCRKAFSCSLRMACLTSNNMVLFVENSLCKRRQRSTGRCCWGKSLSFTGDMKHWMPNSSPNKRGIVAWIEEGGTTLFMLSI